MIYIDTSALLRLVFPDDTTPALQRLIDTGVVLVSSAVVQVEARRGTLRRAPSRLPRTDLLLARVQVVGITDAVVDQASRLPEPLLRALDAIHLATALQIRADVDALLTYDERLATAAHSHGIPVESPS